MTAPAKLQPCLLVVDDEPLIRQELRRLLERTGYAVAEAGSVPEAIAQVPSRFDLVLCDLRLPGQEGTALLEHVEHTPVLIMTSFATIPSAVDAMKRGAADYIAKPFDTDELLNNIMRLLRPEGPSTRRVAAPAAVDPDAPPRLGPFWGESPAMRELRSNVRKVAPTPVTVLVTGESGTGKEVVARSIHTQSSRRAGPFVPVNCAAVPEALFESELFGHERGAFTGAASAHVGLVQSAEGGTLFLDEVGELALSAQARMLRWLQESKIRRVGSNRSQAVNTRLIAATHRDLPARIADSQFREDLYFRLRVFQLRVPPLRERREDIVPLAELLLRRACSRLGRDELELGPEARREILGYHWPGNVRELANAIERAVVLSEHRVVESAALGLGELRREARRSTPSVASEGQGTSIEDYVRRFVVEHQDHLTETQIAQRLGLSRKALWERRRRLGIPRSTRP